MLVALLVTAALFVGISKTSIGGLSVLSVMAFALAMPTKESTGAVLLLYLAGDVVATIRYRRNADWLLLGGLVPWVVPGLVLGAWFLTVVDAAALRRWIGAILAVSVVLQLVLTILTRRRLLPEGHPEAGPRARLADSTSHDRTSVGSKQQTLPRIDEAVPGRPGRLVGTALAGIAAGFTTMAANTGGPVMSLYLLAKRVDKLAFVGTAAWFFFAVNLTKLPFSIGVGAITGAVAWTVLPLVPVVWLGCAIGIRLLAWIGQRAFNALALASAALAAITLLAS